MTLLTDIHSSSNSIEELRIFLETFAIDDVIDADGAFITESVHGVLDRIQHLVQSSKYGINRPDAQKAAQTLASLLVIKKNKDGPKGKALKDILASVSMGDVNRDLENVAPGTSNKTKSFVQQLMTDMEGNKTQTLKVIDDLRDLGPSSDDPWGNATDG